MAHAPGAELVAFDSLPTTGVPGGPERKHVGTGSGQPTTYFCGAYTFEGELCNGLLGLAPLTYVLNWRMALAREQLRDGDAGLAAVAHGLGYASEFSFAAAFKQHHGVAPGRWRAGAQPA